MFMKKKMIKNNSDSMFTNANRCNEVITVDLDESEGEEIEEISLNDSRKWSELPSSCVENIYTFLSRTDQSRMSLVCKRWSGAYCLPSIWKTMKFYLPEYVYCSNVYPEVRFARKYGFMFRQVEIICKRVRMHLLEAIAEQLREFLSCFSGHSQLISVKFINLQNYLRFVEFSMRSNIASDVETFFRAQKYLRTVELYNCHFLKNESILFLTALLENNVGLKFLNLKGFTQDSSEEDNNSHSLDEHLSDICDKFLNLQKLEVEYCQLFVNIILSRFGRQEDPYSRSKTKHKRYLSSITITCESKKMQYFRAIPSAAWAELKHTCPNLSVDMDLAAGTHMRTEIEFFIVPKMPLRTLEFHLDRQNSSSRNHINHLFMHLISCHAHETLETLRVVWGNSILDFSNTLIPFLEASQKLKYLQITAQHPLEGIEDLIKSLLERRPKSLISFHLTVAGVRNEEDYAKLLYLAEEYYPLMNYINLEMILIAEPGWRPRRIQSLPSA